MRFLRKSEEIPAGFEGLEYPRDQKGILRELLAGQKGFCAYSEKFFEPLDSPNVEHFDPRIKGADDFRNWYAVVGKINGRRARKIDSYLPLPAPGSADVQSRIKYEDGEFRPVNDEDVEIENLIRFVRANDELTVKHRESHVRRMADLREWKSEAELHFHLSRHPQDLSFPTALEHALGIPAFNLIEKATVVQSPLINSHAQSSLPQSPGQSSRAFSSGPDAG